MTSNLSAFRPARPFLALALGVAAAVVVGLPVGATSYVMVSDTDLADQAEVIAQVHVVSAEPSPADTLPATDYQVDIDRVIKGYTGGSSVVVRVPGGLRADGLAVKIWGAPELAPGERALLFLTPRTDGTYAVLHLMLGAFHIFEVSRGPVALRNLADAEEVKLLPEGGLSGAPGRDLPRDLAKFASWLQDRVRSVRRPADYFVELPPGALKSLDEKFTTFLSSTGLAIRWFEFDSGGSVPFSIYSTGMPGLPGGGFAEFQTALQAWDNFGPTHIHYLYNGPTTASGGLTTPDGVNAILFDDPHNEIASPFSCTTGGILAHGGPWFNPSQTGSFGGKTFVRTIEADIVTNKGLECFWARSANPSKAAEELFGHELGHTLGLGHSCGDAKSPPCSSDPLKNDALMRTYIHDDGRGARLGSDDMAGIESLYLAGAAPTVCKPNQSTLCLLNRRFLVTVSWQNQFNNSSGSGRAVSRSDSTGFFSFGDPSNIELLIKILDFGSVVKVFYGELTNLHFTISVLDTLSGQVKSYANTAGDCGGIDESAFPITTGASTAGPGEGGGSSGLWLSTVRPARPVWRTQVKSAAAEEGGAVRMGGGVVATAAGASGSCRPNAQTLCLLNNRFAVGVSWANPGNGTSGTAGTARLSDLVGTFYFTDASNVELMTKMIDFGDHIAVFYGALTDLPYTITVTDTVSGHVKTYQSTAGVLCGGLDNAAF